MAEQAYVNQELELLLAPFDADDQAKLQPVVELVYGFYADRAGVWPRLRFCYCQRHLTDHLLRTIYKDVDFQASDLEERLQQKGARLAMIRDEVNAELMRLEAQARGSRTPQIGVITVTAPQPAEPNIPDPNDPAYRGNPIDQSYFPK